MDKFSTSDRLTLLHSFHPPFHRGPSVRQLRPVDSLSERAADLPAIFCAFFAGGGRDRAIGSGPSQTPRQTMRTYAQREREREGRERNGLIAIGISLVWTKSIAEWSNNNKRLDVIGFDQTSNSRCLPPSFLLPAFTVTADPESNPFAPCSRCL